VNVHLYVLDWFYSCQTWPYFYLHMNRPISVSCSKVEMYIPWYLSVNVHLNNSYCCSFCSCQTWHYFIYIWIDQYTFSLFKVEMYNGRCTMCYYIMSLCCCFKNTFSILTWYLSSHILWVISSYTFLHLTDIYIEWKVVLLYSGSALGIFNH